MMTRLHHIALAIKLLPTLLRQAHTRALFSDMRHFCHVLPTHLQQPLPQALAQIASQENPDQSPIMDETLVRKIADLAALMEIRSPLGLCLRRSLTRYHFLHPMGVPVVVQFGARFVGEKADRDVTGHAWLTLNGRPYYEAEENWRDFTVMFRWPIADDKSASVAPQSH